MLVFVCVLDVLCHLSRLFYTDLTPYLSRYGIILSLSTLQAVDKLQAKMEMAMKTGRLSMNLFTPREYVCIYT
jgi:hypothetical protein